MVFQQLAWTLGVGQDAVQVKQESGKTPDALVHGMCSPS